MKVKNVIIIICNLYDMGIWEISNLWNQSSLGCIKILCDGRIISIDSDWTGGRRIHLHRLPNTDRDRNCRIIRRKIKENIQWEKMR